MEPLPISEQFHVEAAKGWVLLGDRNEAHQELSHISRRWRQHPEILEMRWYLLAEEGSWEAALPIARRINEQYPERLFGWLAHAHSLLKSFGDAEGAWNVLLPAADLFAGPQVPYGLACYASLAGRFDEAREWLETAAEKAGGNESDESGAGPLNFDALREFIEKL
jgi:tetratricopeptide (TPR) repeat protein